MQTYTTRDKTDWGDGMTTDEMSEYAAAYDRNEARLREAGWDDLAPVLAQRMTDKEMAA